MHGVPRTPTWAELETTVDVGAQSITLHTAADWVAGDRIAIAPSSYDIFETEERVITAVDNTDPAHPIISFDEPLKYKHYAGI